MPKYMVGFPKEGIFNPNDLARAADFGIQLVAEQIKDDAETLLVKHDTVFTGRLVTSLSIRDIELMKKEVSASTEYAEDIEFGKEPKEFKSFYEGGSLTEFGEWAVNKMGWQPIGDGKNLVLSGGRETSGLRVNKAHPFMLQQGKETAFQYAIDRYLHADLFLSGFMQKLRE